MQHDLLLCWSLVLPQRESSSILARFLNAERRGIDSSTHHHKGLTGPAILGHDSRMTSAWLLLITLVTVYTAIGVTVLLLRRAQWRNLWPQSRLIRFSEGCAHGRKLGRALVLS
jgi:hypothetical protein